jgi:hypothetical protein
MPRARVCQSIWYERASPILSAERPVDPPHFTGIGDAAVLYRRQSARFQDDTEGDVGQDTGMRREDAVVLSPACNAARSTG